MRIPLLNRRRFFARTGAMGTLGAVFGARQAAGGQSNKTNSGSTDVYTRIGLRTIINASGTYTHLGGSLMPPEVIDAMNDAARH